MVGVGATRPSARWSLQDGRALPTRRAVARAVLAASDLTAGRVGAAALFVGLCPLSAPARLPARSPWRAWSPWGGGDGGAPASMAAQSLTPTVSGIFMDKVAMTTLFPYAAIFVGCAFFTMLMVKHGDTKVEAKQGLEALDIDD